MAKKKRKKKKIPIYIDYDYKTIYIQDPRTGEMHGRKRVKGYGDRTAVRRVKRKFDGYKAGEIIGRTSPIVVRKHKRTSKKGKRHKVKKYKRRKR